MCSTSWAAVRGCGRTANWNAVLPNVPVCWLVGGSPGSGKDYWMDLLDGGSRQPANFVQASDSLRFIGRCVCVESQGAGSIHRFWDWYVWQQLLKICPDQQGLTFRTCLDETPPVPPGHPVTPGILLPGMSAVLLPHSSSCGSLNRKTGVWAFHCKSSRLLCSKSSGSSVCS